MTQELLMIEVIIEHRRQTGYSAAIIDRGTICRTYYGIKRASLDRLERICRHGNREAVACPDQSITTKTRLPIYSRRPQSPQSS